MSKKVKKPVAKKVAKPVKKPVAKAAAKPVAKAAAKPAAKKATKVAKPKTVAKPVKAVKVAKPVKKVEVAPKKPAGPVPPKKPNIVVPKNTATKQYSQSELLDGIKEFCGFTTRSEAKRFYGSFTDLLQGALKSGFRVVLPGLGKLQVKKTKPRKGINPLTREPINIPAKKKVAFTAMKALKEAVL